MIVYDNIIIQMNMIWQHEEYCNEYIWMLIVVIVVIIIIMIIVTFPSPFPPFPLPVIFVLKLFN